MKKLIFVSYIFFFCFNTLLLAQEKILLEDHFDQNTGWPEQKDDNAVIKVKKGKYSFESKRLSDGWIIFKDLKFSTKKNFVISYSSEWKSGVDNKGYGFFLHNPNSKITYHFNISGNGYYQFYAWMNDKFIDLIPWTISDFIVKKGNNKIKLQKMGYVLYIYINDKKVNEVIIKDVDVKQIGFSVFEQQKVEFDDLIISYSNDDKENLLEDDDERPLFSEQYDNNERNWYTVNNETGSANIENGKYRVDWKSATNGFVAYYNLYHNTTKDFEFSCTTEWIGGVDNYSYGLFIRKVNPKTEYCIVLAANGYYRFGTWLNNVYDELIKWTESDKIVKRGKNKITLIKHLHDLHIFINDNHLVSVEIDFFEATQIGFWVDNKQKIEFDELKFNDLGNSVLTKYPNITKYKVQSKTIFKDNRDGKAYKTVKIGTQTWFAENLAYKTDNGCWAYDNDANNSSKYGYLYDWKTAKTVCPSGWHLPSETEWKTLTDYLGGEEIAGGKMKGTSEWGNHTNGNATNESGFSAFPAGNRDYILFTGDGKFLNLGKYSYFWSSTPHDMIERAKCCFLRYNESKIYHTYDSRENGYSVRCVKD